MRHVRRTATAAVAAAGLVLTGCDLDTGPTTDPPPVEDPNPEDLEDPEGSDS